VFRVTEIVRKAPKAVLALHAFKEQKIGPVLGVIPNRAVRGRPLHIPSSALAAVPVNAITVEPIAVKLLERLLCVEEQDHRFTFGRDNPSESATTETQVEVRSSIDRTKG
jgi:hypothetical protein